MYAVIFRASIKAFDADYSATASKLRERAMREYGCTEFTSCTEGDQEIAISYWPSMEHIAAWAADEEHRRAQALGREKWYKSYQVEVLQVIR